MKRLVFGLMMMALSGAMSSSRAETNPYFYAVQASATVSKNPAQITLQWPGDANAISYTVSRKAPGTAPWSTVGTLVGTATSFVDQTVAVGGAYEYQIIKNTTVGYRGTGYVLAGIERPLVENRGRVILIVDNTHAATLAAKLTRLERDLASDGWTVVRTDVNRTDSVATVKNIIKGHYNADPANTKAVLLFGRVAVPYSGNFNPDGHPDHQGAWAADVYYGEMNGTWTDLTVNNSSSARVENRNVPGDGKFDQSDLPSDVELAVGRVDFANMTCFANKTPARSELQLLEAYLDKNHTFRQGLISVPQRGIVCDNFGERSGEAFASSGWRNFAPMFGAANVQSVGRWQFLPTLATNAYLWAYGTGGGWYTSCDGVANSDQLAVQEVKAVFSMYLGSYFGDWDSESNLMRAALAASGYNLTVSWAGRPHWFYHHMALGEPIATSTVWSQNNRSGGTYTPQNHGTRQVHAALLGDPTLRMHAFPGARDVVYSQTTGGLTLNWSASPATGLLGYHVYRGTSARGPFTRLTGSPLVSSSFTDAAGSSSYVYLVKAVRVEQSGSGTYVNSSAGTFAVAAGSIQPSVPATPQNLTVGAISSSQTMVRWTDPATNETAFVLQRRPNATTKWTHVATLAPNATSFSDSGLSAGTSYTYRIYAYNSVGNSGVSNQGQATTFATSTGTSATLVRVDTTTGGAWATAYGTEGYSIAGHSSSIPAYAQLAMTGASSWTWQGSTSAQAALVKPGAADRIAACWYSASSYDFNLNLIDGNTHRIALYACDYDAASRAQTIEVIDRATGTLLNSQTLNDFRVGNYLVYDLKGNITIRVRRTAGSNSVTGALFFGAR